MIFIFEFGKEEEPFLCYDLFLVQVQIIAILFTKWNVINIKAWDEPHQHVIEIKIQAQRN